MRFRCSTQYMSDPAVSVITPSYQHAEFLADNLRSVRSQTGPSVEHIVVDGGSTDATVNLLRKFEDDYDLRWISEPDGGQSEAINKGIEMANGEWLIWVNSDDYLLEGALETFADVRDRNPTCDIVYGDHLFVDADGNEIGRKYNARPSTFVHKYYYQFAGNHSTFFKRDVLESVGGIDESYEYAMDTELFWRILDADIRMARVTAFLAARRLHEDAKTTGSPPEERTAEIKRLERQYPQTRIERLLPRPFLIVTAACLQACYHLLDGRPQAIPSMLS
ncbi:Glycosyl transferase family 2 [Halorhabdus sp. SVX81]|nr:Glycosyl transferase family 2 [Halorhabdus sp. SVX81]